MKRPSVNFRLFILFLLINGCAYMSHSVTLDPQLDVAQSDIGKGKAIFLDVIDDRGDEALGQRVGGLGVGEEITIDADFTNTIYGKVADGLRTYNFILVSNKKDAPISLTIEIRDIEYRGTAGLFTFGANVRTKLKVICENESTLYEKDYDARNKIRSIIVPSAEKNNALVNGVVSEALWQVIHDQELLDFLGTEPSSQKKLATDATVHVDLAERKKSKGTLTGGPPAYRPPLIVKSKKDDAYTDRILTQPGVLRDEGSAENPAIDEIEYTHPVIKEKPIPKPTIQKTITAPPETAESYFWQGVAYSKAKQYNKAIWAYKAAINLDPIYAEAHYNLARIYKRKGLNSLAQVHAEKAAEYQPDMEKAYKLLDALQQRQR
ncbi:MAG: tetratricopeptide repeat protein [Planctomycetes bacterium]|nr:tetratricopeptide repeat protein [Planctomycetota bacterium]